MFLRVAIAAMFIGLQVHAVDIATITARVVGVHDGDTLTASTDDKRQLKVRLHGIDASENRPAVRTLELPRDNQFVPQLSQSH